MNYISLKKIRANIRTKPCEQCKRLFSKGGVVIKERGVCFEEDSPFVWWYNLCPKCFYKNAQHEKRFNQRKKQGQEGSCDMADVKFYSFIDGEDHQSDETEYVCHACNVYCTFGNLRSGIPENYKEENLWS
jgi:hypothetical protein